MSKINNNLYNSDPEVFTTFSIMFRLFYLSESYNTIYKNDPEQNLPKNMIRMYYEKVNPNYDNMLSSFRKKYISTESLVEKNDTTDQKQGIGLVYDYIQDYKKEKDFNILIESLQINSKLWSVRDKKFTNDYIVNLKKAANKKIELAKKTKDLNLFREAQNDLKNISDASSKIKIGGHIRSNDEKVSLNGINIHIPSGNDAMKFLNSFSSSDKINEFNRKLNGDIIDYIDYCVRITTDLIKYQPFIDGNKRTFRSLLNLMFKLKNIPPVYIRPKERDTYKEGLFNAILYENYNDIVGFYYYKICDSIYEFDVEPTLNISKKKIKKLDN